MTSYIRNAVSQWGQTPFVVGQDGLSAYTTIASAVSAAAMAGGGLVIVKASTTPYIENLTIPANVIIQGSGLLFGTFIQGTMTFNNSSAGSPCGFTNVTLTASGGSNVCEFSASSGVIALFEQCQFSLNSPADLFHCTASSAPTLVLDSCLIQYSNVQSVFNGSNWQILMFNSFPGLGTAGSGTYSNIDSATLSMTNSSLNQGINCAGSEITMYNSQLSAADTLISPIHLTDSTLIASYCFFNAPDVGTPVAIFIDEDSTADLTQCSVDVNSGATYAIGGALGNTGALHYDTLSFNFGQSALDPGLTITQYGIKPFATTTTVGYASFDPTDFTVSAEGEVSLISGAGSISLRPYIVGPTDSDYTTIQAAINAANTAGASASNPMNIYVKPQSGGYTENLTGFDGINVIAFGEQGSQPIEGTPSVTLNGSIDCSASSMTFKMIGFNIIPGSANAVNAGDNDCSITFENCLFTISSTYYLYITGSVSGIGINQLTLSNCSSNGSGSTFSINRSTGVNIFGGVFSANGTSLVTAFAVVGFDWNNVQWSSQFQLTSGCMLDGGIFRSNLSWNVEMSQILFNVPEGVIGGNLRIFDSTVTQFSSLFSATQGVDVWLSNTTQTGVLGPIDAPLIYANYNTNDCSCIGIEGNASWKLIPGQYYGSDLIMKQVGTQTPGSGTPAVLWAVPLNANEAITVSGTITASDTNHINMVGGNLLICGQSDSVNTCSQIGVPVLNVMSTSTATFSVAVNNVSKRVEVSVTDDGINTYDWVCSINYQKELYR